MYNLEREFFLQPILTIIWHRTHTSHCLLRTETNLRVVSGISHLCFSSCNICQHLLNFASDEIVDEKDVRKGTTHK